MEPADSNQPQSLQVGADVVKVEADALVIYARRPMPDWRIREFQRQPVYFQGEKYYLRDKHQAATPFAVCYELVPWPADLHEESSQRFVYDEAFVAERDRKVLQERGRDFAYYLLLPLYPVLGFCWSGVKERVLWPLGFEPSAISSASTMMGLGFALVDGILFGYLGGGIACQLQFIGVLPPWPDALITRAIDLLVLAVLALDCAIRFNQQLRGDVIPDGFLEWLSPFRRKDRGD